MILCETCRAPGARAYERGCYCRTHRPRPSARDLVNAARQALDEGRIDDLRRLLRLLAAAQVESTYPYSTTLPRSTSSLG